MEIVTFNFPFPASSAVYDDLRIMIDGKAEAFANGAKGASLRRELKPDETVELRVGYRSKGLDHWRYRFGDRKDGDVSQLNGLSPEKQRKLKGKGKLVIEEQDDDAVRRFCYLPLSCAAY